MPFTHDIAERAMPAAYFIAAYVSPLFSASVCAAAFARPLRHTP